MPNARGKKYSILRVKPGSVRVLVLSDEVFGISTFWAGRRRVSFDKDVNQEPRDPGIVWRGYISVIPLSEAPGGAEIAPDRRAVLELTEEAGRHVQALIDANGDSARGLQLTLGRRHARAPVWARATTEEKRVEVNGDLPPAEDMEDAVRRIYRVDWERE